jgi:NAD(P)-dependent dehydrogenase (short-subunit alcohol dehydrogenase family)
MKGKSAVVTGAGMGIGRAIALGFADEKVAVVVADVNEAAGRETVELIRKKGGNAVFVKCDVSKREDVKTMVETAIKEFGSLDYGCNNAGIHPEWR